MEERQDSGLPSGIIGITDDGFPIVTGDCTCFYWMAGGDGTFMMKECWYCKYADFRKTTRITLQKSVCRCPMCRVVPPENIAAERKNEET